MGQSIKKNKKIMRAFAFAACAATALGVKLQEQSDLYGEDALWNVIDHLESFDADGNEELSLEEYRDLLAALDDDFMLDDEEVERATDYYNMIRDGLIPSSEYIAYFLCDMITASYGSGIGNTLTLEEMANLLERLGLNSAVGFHGLEEYYD